MSMLKNTASIWHFSNVNIKKFWSNFSLFKQYKLTANLPRQLQPGIWTFWFCPCFSSTSKIEQKTSCVPVKDVMQCTWCTGDMNSTAHISHCSPLQDPWFWLTWNLVHICEGKNEKCRARTWCSWKIQAPYSGNILTEHKQSQRTHGREVQADTWTMSWRDLSCLHPPWLGESHSSGHEGGKTK